MVWDIVGVKDDDNVIVMEDDVEKVDIDDDTDDVMMAMWLVLMMIKLHCFSVWPYTKNIFVCVCVCVCVVFVYA